MRLATRMRMREGSAGGATGSEQRSDVVLGAGFWVALLVLAINDHVLKGSELVPAMVTGKLSDVAGLLVAPPLACAVLRVRTREARLAVFVLVAGLFTAVNTLAVAAALVGEGLTLLGIPSRLWCDPTDLLALAVLPLAWRWSRGTERPTATSVLRCARWVAASWRAVGLALASLACMATSVAEPEPMQTFPPYVVNRTRLPVTLELGVRLDPECAGAATDASPSAFERPEPDVRIRLDPAELVELGAAASDADEGVCGVAIVRLVDGPEVSVAWDRDTAEPQSGDLYEVELDAGLRRFRLAEDDAWPLSRAVVVTGSTTRPVLQPSDRLRPLASEPAP